MATQEELRALWETATPVAAVQAERTEVVATPAGQPAALSQEELRALWDQAAPGQLPTATTPAITVPTETPVPLPADVPFEEVLAQPQQVTRGPDPTMGQRVTGAAETALSLITGATGGSLGMTLGTLEGLAESIREGTYGTPEGVAQVERQAMQRAGEFTYAPRTETGVEYTEELGELAAPLQALGPTAAARPPALMPRRATNISKPETSDIPDSPTATEKVPRLSNEKLVEKTRKVTEGGIGTKRAKEILAEQILPDEETVAAARRLNVEEYLQPDHVTTSQQYREISQLVKSIPGSEARAAELRGLEQVAKRADDVISEAGGTDDWSTLRSDVKTRLENVQKELDDKVTDYFDNQINPAIPSDTPVDTTNITSYLSKLAKELGGGENLSPMERMLLNRMSPKNGKQPTYALMDRVRKDLTAARVKKQGIFKDADVTQIRKLEKELLADQRAVADRFGVREAFDNARTAVAMRKGIENDMASLFGRQLDGTFITPLRTGVKKIAEGDVTRFKKTIEAIPEEMRPRVVATAMETAFGKSAKRGDISFANYATWYENASRNKQAFNEVMKYLPKESKQQLDDLYKVSDGIRKAQKEFVATGRGETIRGEMLRESIEGTDRLIGKLYSVALPGAIEVALPGAGMVMAVKSALTPKKTKGVAALDQVLTSPQFRQMVTEKARTGDVSQKTASRVANSPQFKKYAKAVGGLPMTPELYLLEAMKPDAEDLVGVEQTEMQEMVIPTPTDITT